MSLRVLLLLIVGLLGSGVLLPGIAWASGTGDTHDHQDGHWHGGDAIRITVWDEDFEVFAEHAPIVAGTPTEFVVHLTRLADGLPRTSGPLTFHCEKERNAVFEQTTVSPARPGIYEVELTYPSAGMWDLTLVLPTPGGEKRLVLPPIRVHSEAGENAASSPSPPEGISFLKEQQWPIPLLTAPAVQRVIDGGRALAIPKSAILYGPDGPSVFVQLDGETFEERHPLLGQGDGAYVIVTSGIDPSERVVTQGVTEVFLADNQGAGDPDHGVHEAQVTMSDADLSRYAIAMDFAAPGQVWSEIELPGEIALNGHKTGQIVARIPGMVGELSVALGDEVRAGQVVAILISRELADAKADYLAAMQREELAAASFTREERLWADQISAEQEFIEARHGHSEAKILSRAARQKLVAIGLSEQQIHNLPAEPDSLLTRFEIRAPFAGSIIACNAQRGEVVSEETVIFKVADLRTVWLDLHVPDRELRRISTGQSVILVEPTEARGFRGNIEYIHPIVDQRSRTVLARVTLPNPDGLLRPRQFVTARVAAEQESVPVVVPHKAIQYLNDEPVVFVREGDAFIARAVDLGDSTADQVAVISGLNPGDQVATRNSFLLKSEVEKQAAGDVGHGHAH